MQVSPLFVCLMGMGVTFIGLTCLIFLTLLLGKLAKGGAAPAAAAPSAAPAPTAGAIPNRQELKRYPDKAAREPGRGSALFFYCRR